MIFFFFSLKENFYIYCFPSHLGCNYAVTTVICNHEVTRLKMESKVQGRQSREMEPERVPDDPVEPLTQNCSCPPAGFFHETMRCGYAEATFIQLFHNLPPKTFQSIFQGNLQTSSAFGLIHTLKIDFWGWTV